MAYDCFFDRLPVELLYNLFNYFSTNELLYTFAGINDYIKKVSWTHFQYQLNFKSIGRSDFDSICSRLQPNQVLSLGLFDDIDTPEQSQLFFSRFPIEQFKRLKSLTLIQTGIDCWKLNFPDLQQLHQLRSLSINIESMSDINNQLLHSQLTHLKLGKCSINELETILQHFPKLKALDVNLNINRQKFQLNLPCKKLIRFNIKIENYCLSMNDVKQFLMKLSYLKHFELRTTAAKDLQNASQWQMLTSSFHTFNFYFWFQDVLRENSLQSFSTPFWLKEKRWFVAYQDYSLFSLPRFSPNTIDISQSLYTHSTAPSSNLLSQNIKKVTISKTWVTYSPYSTNINTLELKCSVPLERISSIRYLTQIKHLSILSSDDLIKYFPLISTMSQLYKLSIEKKITLLMVKQIRNYQFKQILKLKINLDEHETDYIVENLFIIFPQVQYLTIKWPIPSKDLIILVIDGFKHLLNVSFFFENCWLYQYQFNFYLNLIAWYSKRLTESNFTCRIGNLSMTGSVQTVSSLHFWIGEKSVSNLRLLDWLPYRIHHWYRLMYILSQFHVRHSNTDE